MTKDRSEVLSWLALTSKSVDLLEEQAARGPTFEEIGAQWLAGAEAGRISRRVAARRPTPGRRSMATAGRS